MPFSRLFRSSCPWVVSSVFCGVLLAAGSASADRFTPISGLSNEISISVTRKAGAEATDVTELMACGPLPSHLELTIDTALDEVEVSYGTLCGTNLSYFPSGGALRLSLPILRIGSVAGLDAGFGTLSGSTMSLLVPVLASASVGSFGFETGRRSATDEVALTGTLELTEDLRYRLVDLTGTAVFSFNVQAATYDVVADIVLNLEGTDEVSDTIFSGNFESGELVRWSSSVGSL